MAVVDLNPDSQLLPSVIGAAGAVVNSDTGAIAGVRPAGLGVVAGIDFSVRSGVGVFRFASLEIDGNVTFAGSNAVAFVSTTNVNVTALIDLTADCVGGDAGPGGFSGAGAGTAAIGSGFGGGGNVSQGGYSGGGGGANGAAGGLGGTSFPTGPDGPMIDGGAAGTPFGDPAISVLRGGGGGGGGAGIDGGSGGGGGGAIQIVARGRIVFAGSSASYAGVFAGGCGGKRGTAGVRGGGGGGAGGSILMEAGYIDTGFDYTTYLVTGGGGGACDDVGSLGDGEPGGQGSRGGLPGGGDGGTRDFDALTLEGAQGGGSQSGGGGGGAVGRIRFNVVTGLFVPNGGNTVPNLSDAVTTTTRGLANVE